MKITPPRTFRDNLSIIQMLFETLQKVVWSVGSVDFACVCFLFASGTRHCHETSTAERQYFSWIVLLNVGSYRSK